MQSEACLAATPLRARRVITAGVMRVRTLPDDDAECGWHAGLPPLPVARRLSDRERADCVVIGAGFTGLAAARQLAQHRPDWRIVLVDAQRVGDGASGRNSGFIVDVGHAERRDGGDQHQRLTRLGRAGLAELRALVQAHRIECAWREGGRLHGAAGDSGERALHHFVAALEALGERYELLDRAALAAITGSERYRAGARTYSGVMMQPAALVRGLAAALPATVELFEAAPVRTIRRDNTFVLETGMGRILTDRVILATNGYTPALGALRRRIFTLVTFASLTRPLTADEQRALGGEREWGLVCEDPIGTTVRRTADQRILIRNTVQYTPALRISTAARRQVSAQHRHALQIRFPQIADVPFAHTWSGIMGASLNGRQFFGEIERNLWAAAGYNGVGVAMGTISGRLLADQIVGADSALLADIRALPGPTWLPPEPALGIGIRATLRRITQRGRDEI